jgi:hypothetical protein
LRLHRALVAATMMLEFAIAPVRPVGARKPGLREWVGVQRLRPDRGTRRRPRLIGRRRNHGARDGKVLIGRRCDHCAWGRTLIRR